MVLYAGLGMKTGLYSPLVHIFGNICIVVVNKTVAFLILLLLVSGKVYFNADTI